MRTTPAAPAVHPPASGPAKPVPPHLAVLCLCALRQRQEETYE
jgi:hypothetical protein